MGQGLFFFSNTALTSLSLPVLTNVGGTLSVDTNTALTSLNLSVLARTGTMLNISGTALTSLACTRFPAVTLTHAAAQTPMQMRVRLPRAQSTSSQICISSRHCLSHEPVTA